MSDSLKDNDYGGVSRNFLSRTQGNYRAIAESDIRAVKMPEVGSIDDIQRRFAKEFSVADQRMDEKLKAKKTFDNFVTNRMLYGNDDDKTFQQWKQDQAALKERLKIHWLDDMIDHPYLLLVYYARLGTTIGLAYGLGRSIYLYRTMDKSYTRMHGFNFGGVAVQEVSVAVLKGTACAFAGVVGCNLGEASGRLCEALLASDASAPERKWQHITLGFSFSGLLAGSMFSALHRSLLSWKGVAMATSFATLCGVASGWYLGAHVYKPFAASREHRMDEPYWRPWNQRQLVLDGGRQIRGKYV